MRMICGVMYLDGRMAEAEPLQRMVDAMIAPGLNAYCAQLARGSAALAVVDFNGNEPTLLQTDSSLVMAADAHIHEPRTQGEACLLAGLEANETQALSQVLGEFAVAAWNERTSTLTCARDGMGVRPLCFTYQPGRLFAFASVPRALHAGGMVTREVDQDYLLGDLLGAPLGPQRSLFKGIEQVAPGERLRVSPRGLERGQHWQLDRSLGGQRICSPEQAAEEMAALVSEAVRCRIPTAGPVGAHLSGGLDSSSLSILTARMQRQNGQPMLAYSFLPGYLPGLELQGEGTYVRAVLNQEPGITWQPIRIEDHAAFLLPRMDADLLIPQDLAFPDIQVCAHAAGHGATTLLSGWGGDEGATYNGRGALAEALLSGQWRYLAQELRAMHDVHGQSWLRTLRGELLHYLLPDAAHHLWQQWRGRRTSVDTTQTMLRNGRYIAQGPGISIGADAVENRWQLLGAQPHLSRRTESWALMGARHGVAFAFPLLDRRVVELAWSLPSTLFCRGGWKRRLYRDAMVNVLPDSIRWRRNKLSPFPEVLLIQAIHRDLLLNHVEELRGHRLAGDLFDLSAVRRRIEQLPSIDEARSMVLGEDRVRMTTVNRIVPMSLLHAMTWLLQHH